MWVRSLAREDPLEEGMATHSSILAWEIPGTEEPSWQQSKGLQRVGHDWSDLARVQRVIKMLNGGKIRTGSQTVGQRQPPRVLEKMGRVLRWQGKVGRALGGGLEWWSRAWSGITEKRLGLGGRGMRGRVRSGAFRVDAIGSWKDWELVSVQFWRLIW